MLLLYFLIFLKVLIYVSLIKLLLEQIFKLLFENKSVNIGGDQTELQKLNNKHIWWNECFDKYINYKINVFQADSIQWPFTEWNGIKIQEAKVMLTFI